MSKLKSAMTSLNFRLNRLSLLLIVLTCILGCSSFANLDFAFSQNEVTKIGHLSQHKIDRTAIVRGKVITIAPFLESGAYQLQDDSGTVWVFSKNPLPPIGKQLSIQGKVEYQNITVQDRQLGDLYMIELKQLKEKSNSTSSVVETPQSSDRDN